MDAWIPFVLLPLIGWGVRNKLIRQDDWSPLKRGPLFVILTMAGRGTSWDWRLVGIVVAGLIGYESTNLTGHHGFDVNDVLATLVFGAISAVVYSRLLARHRDRTVRR